MTDEYTADMMAREIDAALRDVALYKVEIARLESIIADMAAREVDAALAQGDVTDLNSGEVLWACDNCGTRGVVPRNWGYVPGWTWDDDGKWYCCETCADFAAGERTDG